MPPFRGALRYAPWVGTGWGGGIVPEEGGRGKKLEVYGMPVRGGGYEHRCHDRVFTPWSMIVRYIYIYMYTTQGGYIRTVLSSY